MRIKSMSLLPRFFADSRCTRYLEIAYILLLPIAVWAIYGFSPFNNNDGYIDPWVYFGYVHNFQDLIDRYGLPYYSVRFGLIFPLIALIEIFGPIKGYCAFIYSMYLLAGIPLYFVFRKYFSVHAALFAYTALTSSVWFARTVLWTHPDASAVPYMLAAICYIFIDSERRRASYFFIGALFALAVSSNFFTISISGLSIFGYLVFQGEKTWQRLRKDLSWAILGFLSIYCLGAFGYYQCCQKINIYKSTLAIILWGLGGAGDVYKVGIKELLPLAYIYLPPFLILSLLPIYKKVSSDIRSFFLGATTYALVVIIFVCYWEFASHGLILELYYYFSYFIPTLFICLILIPVILAKASDSERMSLNLAIASFVLPPLAFLYGVVQLHNVPIYRVYLIMCLALMVLFAAIKFKKLIPYAIVTFGLVFHLFWSYAPVGGQPVFARMYGMSDVVGLSRYRLGLKFIETMPKFKEEGRPIFFWYSNADPLANSLQSTYLWGYSRIMDSSPETHGLPFLKGVNIDLFRTNQRASLVLFDRNKSVVNEGLDELRRVDGLRFDIKKFREICEQTLCYTITILDINGFVSKIKKEWQEERGSPLDIVALPAFGVNPILS